MSKISWLAALGLPLQAFGAGNPPARNAPMVGDAFVLPQGATVERDVAYGDDPAQKLDVYRPAHAEGAPVIFMVHGGGWMRGDKSGVRTVKNKTTHWVEKGYVLVSANYRVLPQTRPVEQADDVARALAFVQSKALSWGGDPARVVLMGHSSGAHLVALISADPTIATRLGAKPWLGTIALDSAAYDIVSIMRERHFALYARAFDQDPSYWREASPIHRLKARLSAPMLSVCSSRRADSCAQARAFAAQAESLGSRISVLPVDLTHAEINEQLGTPGAYTEAVTAFIHSLGLP